MGRNQTSFKPGNNANPNGRPKKEWTWAGLIRKAMEEKNLDGNELKDELASVLVAKALEGDTQALKEIGNRVDGYPAQQTDITTNGEKLEVNQLVIIQANDSEAK